MDLALKGEPDIGIQTGWWMAGAEEMTQEKPQERISEKARVLKGRDRIWELSGGHLVAIA